MQSQHKFIHYDRKAFQQVCDDRFFAAIETCYKFISKDYALQSIKNQH